MSIEVPMSAYNKLPMNSENASVSGPYDILISDIVTRFFDEVGERDPIFGGRFDDARYLEEPRSSQTEWAISETIAKVPLAVPNETIILSDDLTDSAIDREQFSAHMFRFVSVCGAIALEHVSSNWLFHKSRYIKPTLTVGNGKKVSAKKYLDDYFTPDYSSDMTELRFADSASRESQR